MVKANSVTEYLKLAGAMTGALGVLWLIISTGGLGSPYYALWLLVIVASGLFGRTYTLALLAATVLTYFLAALGRQLAPAYLSQQFWQFVFTLAAAGLAEWVWARTRKGTIHQLHAATLTGQLTQEQLKAEVLMGSMADGVIVVDNTLKIQLINTSAATLTGWDQASAAGIDYRTIMHLKTPADQDVATKDDPFVEAWNKRQPIVKNELVMVTRAGRRMALSLSISPLFKPDSSPAGAICVFRDISHEKEVERQRGEFISTASHEMRTPVAAIEGYIALALNPKVSTIDDRARSYLTKAHDSTQHLGTLFRDLLSITKLEEGKIGKKLQPIDVGKLLKDVVTDMQFAANNKGLTLTYVPGMSANPSTATVAPYYSVLAEPERLREVVMNLIENAIKFTTKGGVTVRVGGDDQSVTVAVSDTGIGIAPEDIPHLFQKFYRIDNTATRTIGGTGLGLYLCRGLIELYNGRMWVESAIGQGSSFKFSLPRLKNEIEASPAATPTPTAVPPVATPPSVAPTPGTVVTPAVPAPAAPMSPPQAVPASPIALQPPGREALK
jgi:two-component system, OmpR family, sensor histidine kinase VicK